MRRKMIYLIDTDIVIYSLKGNPAVKANFQKYENSPKSISVITYGELYFGAKKSRDHIKNLAVVRRIAELFPIVDISRSVMETFGELKADLQKKGDTISDMDLLIASTAITMSYSLVTNNEKHFSKVRGLKIVNWAR